MRGEAKVGENTEGPGPWQAPVPRGQCYLKKHFLQFEYINMEGGR